MGAPQEESTEMHREFDLSVMRAKRELEKKKLHNLFSEIDIRAAAERTFVTHALFSKRYDDMTIEEVRGLGEDFGEYVIKELTSG